MELRRPSTATCDVADTCKVSDTWNMSGSATGPSRGKGWEAGGIHTPHPYPTAQPCVAAGNLSRSYDKATLGSDAAAIQEGLRASGCCAATLRCFASQARGMARCWAAGMVSLASLKLRVRCMQAALQGPHGVSTLQPAAQSYVESSVQLARQQYEQM